VNDLLSMEELPAGFTYPRMFLRLVERELLYFEPWFILQGDQLRVRYKGMLERFPDRQVVPFARREDNDDVACFDTAEPSGVLILHDFADVGWERPRRLDSVAAWVRLAVEDMLARDTADDELDS
jgi:hypothetical protein